MYQRTNKITNYQKWQRVMKVFMSSRESRGLFQESLQLWHLRSQGTIWDSMVIHKEPRSAKNHKSESDSRAYPRARQVQDPGTAVLLKDPSRSSALLQDLDLGSGFLFFCPPLIQTAFGKLNSSSRSRESQRTG